MKYRRTKFWAPIHSRWSFEFRSGMQRKIKISLGRYDFIVHSTQIRRTWFGLPLPNMIPPLPHTLLSPSPEMYDSSDKAAQYHIIRL
jgi:hypothetical protein